MGQADHDRLIRRVRAVEARERAEATRSRAAAQQAATRAEAERVAVLSDLIQQFLDAMAAADYPGAQVLWMRKPESSWRRRRTEEQVAGWTIAYHQYWGDTTNASGEDALALLIDGRLGRSTGWLVTGGAREWTLSPYELGGMDKGLESLIPETLNHLLHRNGLPRLG
jgi:hypothetical protein